ncbi:hypothetical protein TL16_g10462 [Triparma laevis f. inornata]|uniref:Chloride channel protein n=1 Tax=Triparma laevis f. inornata TaxID=1714386 RepID=A0A9W7ENY5_9STRA|nr:hypothetical protein TL16_g10462 [Triparma laevis f. inornata]
MKPSFSITVYVSTLVFSAGAGVSAAFLAPTAGVILVIEELAFFSVEELHKTFLACITAYGTSYGLRSLTAENNFLQLEWNVGVHDDPQCKHSVYTVPFFVLLGAACGVVGALFNYLNIHVVGGLRKKYNKTWHKVLVVFVMCIITSATFVLVPFAGKCQEATINTMYDRYDPTYGGMGRSFCPHTEWDKEIADLQRNSSVKEMSWLNVSLMEEEMFGEPSEYSKIIVQFNCEEGLYNPLASLLFQPAPEAIKVLFQQGLARVVPFEALFVSFLLHFCLAILTAGVSLPTGLVIPYIFMGGCLGRMAGQFIHALGYHIDIGFMAVVGAGAMMAGSGRICLFMTVVMVEITNDLQMAPPIAVATLTAVFIGNKFNHGYYHEQIYNQAIPFVEDEPDESQEKAAIEEVMGRDPITLNVETPASAAFSEILNTPHNGFPVVDEEGTLVGLVSRRLLKDAKPNHLVSDCMDYSPIVARPTDALGRTLRLFRRMGCRHLPIVDSNFKPVGILTRKDLLPWVIPSMHEDVRFVFGDETQREAANASGSLQPSKSFGSQMSTTQSSTSSSLARPVSRKKKEFEKRRSTVKLSVNPLLSQQSSIDTNAGVTTGRLTQTQREMKIMKSVASSRTLLEFAEEEELPSETKAAFYFAAGVKGVKAVPLNINNYRWYKLHVNNRWRFLVFMTALLLVAGGFFEAPRPAWSWREKHLGPALTAAIEILIVSIQMFDYALKAKSGMLNGRHSLLSHTHLFCCIFIFLEVIIMAASSQWGGLYYRWRLGRLLRSFILLQSSRDGLFVFRHTILCVKPLMKVFSLAFFVIAVFSLVFYQLFSDVKDAWGNPFKFFNDYYNAIDSLVVAMTTANFPDVMMPYYQVGSNNLNVEIANNVTSLLFATYMIFNHFLLSNVFLTTIFHRFSALGEARAIKNARRKRYIFIECFMGLSGGDEHVSYEKFYKMYRVLKEEKLLPWTLPSLVDGCAPIEETLYKALAREVPERGLVFHEFIKLTEILQQKLTYEGKEGSFNKPTARVLEQIRGIRNFVQSKRFDYTICFLLIGNATNIYFRQSALKECGYGTSALDYTNNPELNVGTSQESCKVPEGCQEATFIPNIMNLVFSCLFCVEFIMRCKARVFVFDFFGIGDALIILFCFISDLVALSDFTLWTCSHLSAPIVVLRYLRFARTLSQVQVYTAILNCLRNVIQSLGAFFISLFAFINAFAVVGLSMFEDDAVLKITPSEADVLDYCNDTKYNNTESNLYIPYVRETVDFAKRQQFCGGYFDFGGGEGGEKHEMFKSECFMFYGNKGHENHVPCEFINPHLRGTQFESEGYYHLNFKSYWNVMVVLFALLLVNNWHIIKDGYAIAWSKKIDTDAWTTSHGFRAHMYFYAFWLIAVVLQMSILFNMIFESFSIEMQSLEKKSAREKHQNKIQSRFRSAEGPLVSRRLIIERRMSALADVAAKKYEVEIKETNRQVDLAMISLLKGNVRYEEEYEEDGDDDASVEKGDVGVGVGVAISSLFSTDELSWGSGGKRRGKGGMEMTSFSEKDMDAMIEKQVKKSARIARENSKKEMMIGSFRLGQDSRGILASNNEKDDNMYL